MSWFISVEIILYMRHKLSKNSTFSQKDGDWIDIIEMGKYSEIVNKVRSHKIKDSDIILEDIQCIINEYNIYGCECGDIDVCLVRLGNRNVWSNYTLIFDQDNSAYIDYDIPYENDLLFNVYFDIEWYYEK